MKKILIVDDDSEILESLATLLREKYEVAVASNGFGALEKVKEKEYDLILLDFRMPGLDGAGVVRALQESGNRTKILLMSASTNVAQHAHGLSVADYVGKPFHIDVLEAKIERLIGNGHAADAGGKAGAAEMSPPGPPGLAQKLLVLFVDDEPEILASVKTLLSDEPYELLTTERPEQALRWVQERAVSLIISDQVMPDELGTEFLKDVRARSPATLCAIVTAYPEGGKLLGALKQGIFLIPKPLDVENLKVTIRNLLHDREKA
jgi:DNA-binding response OmpR family regulator